MEPATMKTFESYCRERKWILNQAHQARQRIKHDGEEIYDEEDDVILELVTFEDDRLGTPAPQTTKLSSHELSNSWSLSSNSLLSAPYVKGAQTETTAASSTCRKSIQSYTGQLFSPVYEVTSEQQNVFQENRRPLPKAGRTPKFGNLCYKYNDDICKNFNLVGDGASNLRVAQAQHATALQDKVIEQPPKVETPRVIHICKSPAAYSDTHNLMKPTEQAYSKLARIHWRQQAGPNEQHKALDDGWSFDSLMSNRSSELSLEPYLSFESKDSEVCEANLDLEILDVRDDEIQSETWVLPIGEREQSRDGGDMLYMGQRVMTTTQEDDLNSQNDDSSELTCESSINCDEALVKTPAFSTRVTVSRNSMLSAAISETNIIRTTSFATRVTVVTGDHVIEGATIGLQSPLPIPSSFLLDLLYTSFMSLCCLSVDSSLFPKLNNDIIESSHLRHRRKRVAATATPQITYSAHSSQKIDAEKELSSSVFGCCSIMPTFCSDEDLRQAQVLIPDSSIESKEPFSDTMKGPLHSEIGPRKQKDHSEICVDDKEERSENEKTVQTEMAEASKTIAIDEMHNERFQAEMTDDELLTVDDEIVKNENMETLQTEMKNADSAVGINECKEHDEGELERMLYNLESKEAARQEGGIEGKRKSSVSFNPDNILRSGSVDSMNGTASVNETNFIHDACAFFMKRAEYTELERDDRKHNRLQNQNLFAICPNLLFIKSSSSSASDEADSLLKDAELRAVMKITDGGNHVQTLLPSCSYDSFRESFDSDDGLEDELSALMDFEDSLRKEMQIVETASDSTQLLPLTSPLYSSLNTCTAKKTLSRDRNTAASPLYTVAKAQPAKTTTIRRDLIKPALLEQENSILEAGGSSDCSMINYLPLADSSSSSVFDNVRSRRKVRFSDDVQEFVFISDVEEDTKEDQQMDKTEAAEETFIDEVVGVFEELFSELRFTCATVANVVDNSRMPPLSKATTPKRSW